MSYYTTLENVQAELRLDTAFDNNTIPSSQDVDRWIQEESKIIEIKSGQVFSSTSESSTYYDYDGSGIFRLPKTPFISITKLEYNVNSKGVSPSWIELEEGFDKNFISYADEGEIEFIGGQNPTHMVQPLAGSKKFRLTWTYGYKVTPPEIQKLCTLLVAKRTIMSLVNSQSNSEGGNIQIGTISVTDPSNYSVSYLKSMNEEINSLFNNIGQGLNTFRITRNY